MKKLKWLILRWLLGEKYERGSGDVLAMIYSLGGSVSDNTNDIIAIKRDIEELKGLMTSTTRDIQDRYGGILHGEGQITGIIKLRQQIDEITKHMDEINDFLAIKAEKKLIKLNKERQGI